MRAAILALALAACTSVPAELPPPTLPQRAVASIDEINGRWDIVSFNEHRPARLDADGNRHAFVDIQGGSLSFSIQCNYSGMQARVENGRLIKLPGDDIQTTAGCGEERHRRDDAFFGLLRSNPSIARLGDDQIVLSHGGDRLVLQRSEARQRPLLAASLNELRGRWTADIIYHHPEPGRTDNLISWLDGEPARFDVTGDTIRLRVDCEDLRARLHLTAPGQIHVDPVSIQREIGRTCRIPAAQRTLIASLLDGTFTAERIAPNMMQLDGGDVRTVLTRAD